MSADVDTIRLPTLDDLAPVLLTALDEDDALSVFQALVEAGYRIIPAAALDRLAAAEAQRVTLAEALRGMVEPDPDTDGYAELEAARAALAAVTPTEAKP